MAQKVAVVTGGNKGIGFAIVRALCSKFDGDVYLTGAEAPVYCALLPRNIKSPKGEFIWEDKSIGSWH